MNIHILYHGGCPDGFGAAWSLWNYYKAQGATTYPLGNSDKIFFWRENQKSEVTLKLMADKRIKDEQVLYIDICPKRPILEKMHSLAAKTNVIDHHLSNQRDCGDLDYCFFDMDRSGAGLAWDIFCSKQLGIPRPLLIDCIEDQDLWRWKVPNSPEYLIGLELIRFDFNLWQEYSDLIQTNPEEILAKGRAMVEYRNLVTRRSANKYHKLTIGGTVFAAVNGNVLQSGVGNYLCSKTKEGVAAIYYNQGKRWLFSLRSTDEGPDVSIIAAQYGGGGHHNAAGFAIDHLESLVEFGKHLYTSSEVTEEELKLLINSHTDQDCENPELVCTLYL